MKKDVYQIITDRITGLLEAGTVPWRKPWKGGEPPQNLVSRKPYRGINVFLLNASKFTSPFWLSFKQVQAVGARVRKGEHSFPVVFWKLLDPKKPERMKGDRKRVPYLRYYSVFNLEQCENVNPKLAPAPQTGKFHPIERCERMVAGMPKPPQIVHGGVMASYSPMADKVLMPEAKLFESSEFYYNTLFHELTHATGHTSRLNRKEVTGPVHFGSDPYSHEELVAEMGAAFLCGHCAIENHTIKESAGYIQGWLNRLRDDRKLLVCAGAQAQRACDFIRGNEYPREGERDGFPQPED